MGKVVLQRHTAAFRSRSEPSAGDEARALSVKYLLCLGIVVRAMYGVRAMSGVNTVIESIIIHKNHNIMQSLFGTDRRT